MIFGEDLMQDCQGISVVSSAPLKIAASKPIASTLCVRIAEPDWQTSAIPILFKLPGSWLYLCC